MLVAMDIEDKRFHNQKLERKIECITGITGLCGWALASYADATGLVSQEVGLAGVGLALTALALSALICSTQKRQSKTNCK